MGKLMAKIAILEIKIERIKNSSRLDNIACELDALRRVRVTRLAKDWRRSMPI
jgi:hypothetical protein